ncbi:DUF2339 domain-containing protein [Sphingomonas asaccharolytica]|uniref:DUF2339 domain-containing protein n=1 Tax=Sphingomonas asaccharolytica TaxID=40681 RepID=UPI00082CC2AE|nr:DUF2339 domain-containing protein [Sphingomonas asaccharolytica]
MTALALIGLMVVAAVLWQRIDALKLRITSLELALDRSERIARSDMPNPTRFEQADWIIPEPQPSAEAPSIPEAVPMPEARSLPDYVAAPTPEAVLHPPAVEPAPQGAEDLDRPMRRFGFEDIFGRYLPIWAGGITLAVAGFLIVKYSIDAGLLSPPVRVVLGLVFGSGLIAGAELALRRDDVARDPRIRQALSGAGVATLYASVLVAANLYHLIGPMAAFAGLAAITLLAGLLSIRFGAPSAVLGLVGGLVAPALVGSASPDVPLLASWLALTAGGLSMLGRRQGWWWLGALAIAGGFGWGLLLIAAGLHDVAAALSVGMLTLMLAIVFPLAMAGDPGRSVRVIAALIGCAQMAAIVATGGFAPLDWGLFALLSVAMIWLARREPSIAELPIAGLVVGLLLAATWPNPDGMTLALVQTGGSAIYGLPALWRLWRSDGRLSDAAQIAALGFAGVLIPAGHFWFQQPRADFAPLALLAAVVTAGTAGWGWRATARRDDARFAILSISAIGLAALGASLAAPVWVIGPIIALAAVAMLLLGRAADDGRIGHASLVAGLAALALLIGYDANEIGRAVGLVGNRDAGIALLRWTVGAAAAASFARWSIDWGARQGSAAMATLLVYVVAAQIVPTTWLALVPAAMLAGAALAGRRTPLTVAPAAAVLSIGWAVQPLLIWAAGAGGSIIGVPFLVTATPPIDMTLIRVAAPACVLVALLLRDILPERLREIGSIIAILLSLIAAHSLWKHVFAIADAAQFIAAGMAERSVWEALLAAAAIGAWRLGTRRIAIGLGIAALLHFAWFTAALHNSLWTDQWVGPWLVPAYGIAFALLWLSRHAFPEPGADRARDGMRMALILLLAASLLRQAFHGSLLSEPGTSQAEDIGRSLTAIVIAIGFLQWGIRRASRDWRIVSLVLMLAAVGKVFLFDAAGLDGLLRIASFAALGFSLIGVGWLYSRYLPDAALTDTSHSPDTIPADTRG